jgi:hypothetical protein
MYIYIYKYNNYLIIKSHQTTGVGGGVCPSGRGGEGGPAQDGGGQLIWDSILLCSVPFLSYWWIGGGEGRGGDGVSIHITPPLSSRLSPGLIRGGGASFLSLLCSLLIGGLGERRGGEGRGWCSCFFLFFFFFYSSCRFGGLGEGRGG